MSSIEYGAGWGGVKFAMYDCVDAGQQARVRHISIQGLVPQTDNYITYDGSLTQPGCQETVTWIIVNKPLYISQDNV